MSTCPSCAPGPEECTTVYQQLNPCRCDSPGGIEETGPDGGTGPRGETPQYFVGTVSGGTASITVVETGYATRDVNWVLPAVPEDVPYTWSEVNTFTQPSIFEQGFETTGGEVTIGGTALTVTPDVTLSADVHVAGNQDVAGDVNITTHLNEDSNLTVQGDSDFNDIEFFLHTNLEESTFTLTDLAGYAGGILVLGSCLNMERQPNIGSAQYDKAEASGLTPVGPVDNGEISNPIVINVPVSSCFPQVTPMVNIKFRVSYEFGGSPGVFNSFTAQLWLGGVGVTALDFYVQGDPATFNSWYGTFDLMERVTLAAGNNSFTIEVTNNDNVQTFNPLQVTFWLEA